MGCQQSSLQQLLQVPISSFNLQQLIAPAGSQQAIQQLEADGPLQLGRQQFGSTTILPEQLLLSQYPNLRSFPCHRISATLKLLRRQ